MDYPHQDGNGVLKSNPSVVSKCMVLFQDITWVFTTHKQNFKQGKWWRLFFEGGRIEYAYSLHFAVDFWNLYAIFVYYMKPGDQILFHFSVVSSVHVLLAIIIIL